MKQHRKARSAGRMGVLLAAFSWVALWLSLDDLSGVFSVLGFVVGGTVAAYLTALALRVREVIVWAPSVIAGAYLVVAYDSIIDHALTGREGVSLSVTIGEFLLSAALSVFLVGVSVREADHAR